MLTENIKKVMTEHRWLLWSVGVLMAVLVGLADYATGHEISFSVFYLIPILAMTWYGSRTIGLVFSLACSAEWFVVNGLTGATFSHAAIPFWNMLVRLLFFLIVVLVLSRLRELLEREQALSRIDGLTGAFNKRYVTEAIGREIFRSQRYGKPVATAYFDIDNFKWVNDNMGHDAGDHVLKVVTDVAKKNVRPPDVVSRLGGDEFVILFPEIGLDGARATMDRILGELKKAVAEHNYPVSFSVGLVAYLKPPVSVEMIIKEADRLMYIAKKNGKDRMECLEISDPARVVQKEES